MQNESNLLARAFLIALLGLLVLCTEAQAVNGVDRRKIVLRWNGSPSMTLGCLPKGHSARALVATGEQLDACLNHLWPDGRKADHCARTNQGVLLAASNTIGTLIVALAFVQAAPKEGQRRPELNTQASVDEHVGNTLAAERARGKLAELASEPGLRGSRLRAAVVRYG